MTGICDGRVAIVTGAGRGLGREYALELARQGAMVVVNDLGVARDGEGADATPAEHVVGEIEALGGQAVANTDDVAEPEGADRLVAQAVEVFGELHAVVNNAGILRDRTLVNMTIDEWRSVIHVHLDSTYAVAHAAANVWRSAHKAGRPVDGRIINTSSSSGIFGNPGQTNYGTAKAGIAAFTVIAADELARYGVTVNAIAPGARTRMTEELIPPGTEQDPEFDRMDPANVAPLVTWLCSAESHDVTGRVFEANGDRINLCVGWTRGRWAENGRQRWDAATLGPVIADLVAEAPPRTMPGGG